MTLREAVETGIHELYRLSDLVAGDEDYQIILKVIEEMEGALKEAQEGEKQL